LYDKHYRISQSYYLALIIMVALAMGWLVSWLVVPNSFRGGRDEGVKKHNGGSVMVGARGYIRSLCSSVLYLCVGSHWFVTYL